MYVRFSPMILSPPSHLCGCQGYVECPGKLQSFYHRPRMLRSGNGCAVCQGGGSYGHIQGKPWERPWQLKGTPCTSIINNEWCPNSVVPFGWHWNHTMDQGWPGYTFFLATIIVLSFNVQELRGQSQTEGSWGQNLVFFSRDYREWAPLAVWAGRKFFSLDNDDHGCWEGSNQACRRPASSCSGIHGWYPECIIQISATLVCEMKMMKFKPNC